MCLQKYYNIAIVYYQQECCDPFGATAKQFEAPVNNLLQISLAIRKLTKYFAEINFDELPVLKQLVTVYSSHLIFSPL